MPAPCDHGDTGAPRGPTERLARYLHLAALRRQADGPEPCYLAVELDWSQTQHRWRAIARDALAWWEDAA